MLSWEVNKLSNGNDYWFAKTSGQPGNDFVIYQELLDNHIMYALYTLGHPPKKFETLQEAKQACEPVEKPYEVGYKEERKWGSFEILAVGPGYVIKKLYIKAGCSISYQYHEKRQELWKIIKGSGNFKTEVVDYIGYNIRYFTKPLYELGSTGYEVVKETTKKYSKGDILNINVRQKHKMTAIDDLEIIELWTGEDLRESDIVRLD